MKIKRALYLTHRWFGIALSLMFLLWFASGIIMMYVEYPEFTEKERLQSKPALNLNAINYNLNQLSSYLLPSEKITQLSLTSVLDRPSYQLEITDTKYQVRSTLQLFADTGEMFEPLNTVQAVQVAHNFSNNMAIEASPEYMGLIDMDQWTISSALNTHRPLHKVALNDNANTILYISDSNGQVIRDTHGWERGWNWLGSTIHWIYPKQLRRNAALWVDVVVWLSIAGVVATISGTIVGVLRVRVKKRYKNGSITPYSGLQKWHHILGLSFTVIVSMFIISGLFSMNPFGIFDNKTSAGPQISRYLGTDYNLSEFQTSLDTLIKTTNTEDKKNIKELRWQTIANEGILVAYSEDNRSVINVESNYLNQKIINAASKLLPDHQYTLTKLTEFDNYYYSTHNRYKPLPAYRIEFNDEENTWYYIDAITGEILSRATSTDRVQRWLYNGLHSLDFRFLMNNRPLWDIIVITLSIIGIVFSYTSLVIAWRRLLKTKLFKTSATMRRLKESNPI
jgi:uncharacterized iron-regulated membrane protein